LVRFEPSNTLFLSTKNEKLIFSKTVSALLFAKTSSAALESSEMEFILLGENGKVDVSGMRSKIY
jgi:hypothetical protein